MVMEFHVYTPRIVSLKIAILPNNDMDAGYKQKKNLFSLLEKRFYIWFALGHHNETRIHSDLFVHIRLTLCLWSENNFSLQ